MGDLLLGVDSGVGPPGSHDRKTLPGLEAVEPPKRFLHLALNRPAPRLELPPREIGPVVGEIEAYSQPGSTVSEESGHQGTPSAASGVNSLWPVFLPCAPRQPDA